MISRCRRHPCLKFFYTACVLFGLLGVIYAQQTSEKLVRVNQAVQITDAVFISNVAVAGKPIEGGLFIKAPGVHPAAPFQAGSDWLQQMTISLVNRTNKTIVFGSILLHFLDTGDCSSSQPCVGAALSFGQRPLADSYNSRTGQLMRPEPFERPSIEWKAGQTFVVHVSDYIDEIAGNLSNAPHPLAVTDITQDKRLSWSFLL